jgi:hypothetical protein
MPDEANPFGGPPPTPPQGGFGAPPPDPGFGAPANSGFGAPPPDGGFGAPPPDGGFGGFEANPAGPPSWDGGGAPMSPPQQPKKGKGPLVLVIVLIVVVLLGGGGAGWYFFFGPGKSHSSTDAKGGDKGKGSASPSTSPSGEVKAAGVQKGDCVVPPKTGNSVTPSKCSAKGALKVIDRINGTTNDAKCPKPETNYTYKFTSYSDSKKSFVLCLATQK